MRCEIFSSNNEVQHIYATKTICTRYMPVTVYGAKDLDMSYLFLVPVYKEAPSTTGGSDMKTDHYDATGVRE